MIAKRPIADIAQVDGLQAGLDAPLHRGQGGVVFPVCPWMTTTSGGLTPTAKRLYLARGVVNRSWPLRSIGFYVDTAAGEDDSCYVCLYDRDGNLLASSAATAGKLNSIAYKSIVFPADFTLIPNTVYYAGIVVGDFGGTAVKIGNALFSNNSAIKMFGTTLGYIESDYQSLAYPPPDPVVPAGGAASVPLLVLNETSDRIVALGDSVTANPGVTTNYGTRLQGRLGPYSLIINQGVGGNTTTALLARIAGVTAERPHTVLVLGGINDILADASAATIEGNLTSIYAAIAAAGAVPKPVCILPFGAHASWTAGREAVRIAVNAWIAAQGYAHTTTEALGDGDPSQPRIQAGFDSGDGLHLNAAGATALSAVVYAQGFSSTQSARP